MKISAIILSLALFLSSATEPKTIVTKIHEDDRITILSSYNGNIEKSIIHGYDFNIPIRLSEEIPTQKTVGKFTDSFNDVDGKTYYQFKSNDNSVWWTLTETEIGLKPSTEKEYMLLYCDNGTTAANKKCECLPEWNCECEVYDDIFIGIFEKEN